MDQTTGYKHVDFSKCNTCEFKDLADNEYPCSECLETPAREYSHTPVFYKKKASSKLANTIRDTIKRALDIHSPSRVMYGLDKYKKS